MGLAVYIDPAVDGMKYKVEGEKNICSLCEHEVQDSFLVGSLWVCPCCAWEAQNPERGTK